MLLTGLLKEIEHLAKKNDYRTIFIEAHEDQPLGVLIIPYLRSLLFDLNRRKKIPVAIPSFLK